MYPQFEVKGLITWQDGSLLDYPNALLCKQHLNVVAGQKEAHFKYFVYCCIVESIKVHHFYKFL